MELNWLDTCKRFQPYLVIWCFVVDTLTNSLRRGRSTSQFTIFTVLMIRPGASKSRLALSLLRWLLWSFQDLTWSRWFPTSLLHLDCFFQSFDDWFFMFQHRHPFFSCVKTGMPTEWFLFFRYRYQNFQHLYFHQSYHKQQGQESQHPQVLYKLSFLNFICILPNLWAYPYWIMSKFIFVYVSISVRRIDHSPVLRCVIWDRQQSVP